jgi:hypothetical protein
MADRFRRIVGFGYVADFDTVHCGHSEGLYTIGFQAANPPETPQISINGEAARGNLFSRGRISQKSLERPINGEAVRRSAFSRRQMNQTP